MKTPNPSSVSDLIQLVRNHCASVDAASETSRETVNEFSSMANRWWHHDRLNVAWLAANSKYCRNLEMRRFRQELESLDDMIDSMSLFITHHLASRSET